MSMKIEVDPSGLTKEQREAVAGFILAYPCGEVVTPLSVGRKPAPFTAVAPVSRIAPEDMPEISLIEPFSGPPPPVAPPAPMGRTVALPTVPPAGNADTDAKGFPWNHEIHSSSREKNADGTWRKKRGVDPAKVVSVEETLKKLMAIPSPQPAASAEVLPFAITSTPAEMLVNVAMPPPPETPANIPPPAPTTAGDRGLYLALIGKASAAIQSKKISPLELDQCCQAVNVDSIHLLANRLDLVGLVSANFDALIASKQ